MFVLDDYIAEMLAQGKGVMDIVRGHQLLEAEVQNLEFASEAAGADALGIAALPFVAVYGYYRAIKWSQEQAEEDVANENYPSGFSQGYMAGLLGWKWTQLADRFARLHALRIYQRDSLNLIWQRSYNQGLIKGYFEASQTSVKSRNGYLKVCREVSGAKKGNWDRRDQINYVVEMAAAFRRKFLRL